MRVSMADVAEKAGVSAQTVSRVANGSPRVDPATRARVEKAMADLGYRMHRAARALRTGQTSTIGLVVSTLASVGNSRMLQAISEAAAARDYALAVVTVGERGIRDAFARLRSQGVDGAVVLNEATELARDAAPPADLHLVVVDSPPDERFSIVQTDHAGGARAATEYLLSLGHSTVHHIAGPARSFAATERERGWREALARAGAVVPEPVRGIGPRHPVTRPSAVSAAPARSSWRTTRWRSGPCGPSPTRVGGCPKTSPWWASTTSWMPRSSARR
ncbi:LacI family DNA-binding transcriptional regulator [Microbacterium sp. SL62]|uniref:LacI family DNA-binding transcriptional regulator n=1 Tax=Microbacterium sp. SL62 TaxID=2995139 RepID=UPI003FA3B1F9